MKFVKSASENVQNSSTERTTILLVGPFPKNSSNIGGASIWNQRVLSELVRRHIDVVVVPWYGAAPSKTSEKTELITERSCRFWLYFSVYFFLKLHIIAPFVLRRYLVSIKDLYRMVRLFVYLKGVAKQLDKSRHYTIIASHIGFRSLFAIMLRQQLERSECVIDVHGGGVLKFGETHRELVRFLLDSTDKVIVRNNYMKQECLKRGVDLAKVFLVPCGIEVSNQTEMPEKQNIVAFCGALTPHKDPMTLLTAIPMVRERTARNIQFVFIGEGELKGRMLSIIEKNALGDLVKLFGALPNEKVRKCFQMAKILVLPSTRESFGIVLLEAMNCYTPCIVTNVGGMPELVDSDVGFVVEPGSPQAIADSIVRLLNDNELWEKKARLAYKRSLQYDMKNIGNLLVRALNIDNN